ncbi:phosphoglycerate kinase [Pseudomonas aeruginosa]|nr:phosphoglycerate kinase [Pseudomonas aeruginosa]
MLFETCASTRAKKNADELAQKYAALCDVFVMDAFGTAHRAEGRPTAWPVRQGRRRRPLLAAELDALGKALGTRRGRWRRSSPAQGFHKLDVLNSLAGICDRLIVGGGIASTFLAAAGHKIGKSLYEADLVETAKAIAAKVKVPLPVDMVVAKENSPRAPWRPSRPSPRSPTTT